MSEKIIYDGNPKHTPFFNNGNSNQFRKTNLEIRIDYGANEVVNKIIKRVYLRNVGQELDATGQPIFNLYEFVAQDIIDSDNTFSNSDKGE